MPTTLPTPVAAVIGIVPAVLDNARKLPAKAVQLPVLAVSSALTALETWRREYDDLARRGERLVGRLRGTAVDEFEDRIEDLVAKTPFGGAYDTVEDAVQDAVEDTVAKVTELLDRAAARAPSVKAAARSTTAQSTTAQSTTAQSTTAQSAGGKSAPVETAATPDVVEVVEAVTAAIAASPDAAPVTSHDELPLDDYDHMTLGALRGRLRALSVEDLVRVRDYERAHAHRLPVVTLLDHRIAKLATEAAAGPVAPPTESAAPAKKGQAKKSPAQKARVQQQGTPTA